MQFLSYFEHIFNNNNFLGVDIGSFSIKLAELAKGEKNSNPKLLVLDEITISKNNDISDEEKSRLLLNLIRKNEIKTRRVIFSIDNYFTNYTIISFPLMKDREILEYIKLNLTGFLPIEFKDVYLEWKVLEKNENNLKVLLIAVNKDIIARYKEIAKKANLNFYSYITEAEALLNSLISKTKEENIVLLLDIRMKSSSLSTIKNKKLLKSSSLNLSVNALAENFTKLNQNIKFFQNEEEENLFLEKKNKDEERKKAETFQWNIENEINKDEKVIATDDKELNNLIKKEDFIKSKEDKIKEINHQIENINHQKQLKIELKIFLDKKTIIDNKKNYYNSEIKKFNIDLNNITKEEFFLNLEKTKIEKKEKITISLIPKREIEKKRWKIEDEIEKLINIKLEIENNILKRKNELKIINEESNIIESKILEKEKKIKTINDIIGVKEIEIKFQKEREIEVETEIEETETETEIEIKSLEPIQIESEIKIENKTIDELKEKYEIDSFFELFYKKIWLFIISIDINDRKYFKKIVISGGADFIPGLTQYIQKKINMKLSDISIEIANPFININDNYLTKKSIKISQFSNSIGAGLKEFK